MEIKDQDQQGTGLNSTGELNLYLDLLAFSELSSEEQLAYKERLKIVSSEQVLEATDEPPATIEPPAATVAATDQFKASGPLSITGFLFDPASNAAPQVMSLAVCATCGSETDGEDLFCIECGAFMDEKAADEASRDEASGPVCDDCGLVVATGELICPACGTLSPVC